MSLKQSPGGGMVLDFRDHIAAWSEKTKKSIYTLHRGVSLKLFEAIIVGTPVDTGEAAGGWVAAKGHPYMGPSGRIGPGPAVSAMKSVLSASVQGPDDLIYFLSNSVDHITGLEYGTHSYGFSPKAPAGMVRINIMRFRRLVSEEVARIKS